MRTMRTNGLLAMVAIAGSGFAFDAARAQTSYTSSWSMTGAACVPTGQTISGIGTFNSAGDAKFPAGRLGEIILTCQIAPTVRRANFMLVTYRDTDGRAQQVQLRAALRRKELETGAVADVPSAVFDSNTLPASAGNVRRGAPLVSCSQGFIFDHSRFTYYVQVNMTKRSNAQEVLLSSVEVGTETFCG
jgi:hypothetical protein